VDNQVIYDLLKDVKEEQKDISSQMSSHLEKFSEHLVADQQMLDEVKYIKQGLEKNNEILEKLTETVIIHENRSTTLESIVIGSKEDPGLLPRVEKLEEPDKIREYLRKKYMKWGAVITMTTGIIVGISKLLGYW
jgi:actin-related protein